MKLYVLILALVAISFYSISQENKEITVLGWGTDYSYFPEYLNGRIEEVQQNCYWANIRNGNIEKGRLLTLKEHKDSSILQDFRATFDASGTLLRYDVLGENNVVEWSRMNELKDGLVQKENWILHDTVLAYAVYNYDEHKHITSIPYYPGAIRPFFRRLDLTHNEKGNMTFLKAYNPFNELIAQAEFNWNDDNRVTEILRYSVLNTLLERNTFTYNDHGFFSTMTFANLQSGTERSWTVTHTYDEKGNWIQRIMTEAGRPVILLERKYTYY